MENVAAPLLDNAGTGNFRAEVTPGPDVTNGKGNTQPSQGTVDGSNLRHPGGLAG